MKFFIDTADVAEIRELAEEAMQVDPAFSLEELMAIHGKTDRMELAIRSIIGMDVDEVEKFFGEFMARERTFTANQRRFLRMLQKHISQYGVLKAEQLWESPFTTIHSEGVTGIFEDDKQVDEILGIIRTINLENIENTESKPVE